MASAEHASGQCDQPLADIPHMVREIRALNRAYEPYRWNSEDEHVMQRQRRHRRIVMTSDFAITTSTEAMRGAS